MTHIISYNFDSDSDIWPSDVLFIIDLFIYLFIKFFYLVTTFSNMWLKANDISVNLTLTEDWRWSNKKIEMFFHLIGFSICLFIASLSAEGL